MNGGGCNVDYVGVWQFFAPELIDIKTEYSKVVKYDIDIYTFIMPSGLGKS